MIMEAEKSQDLETQESQWCKFQFKTRTHVNLRQEMIDVPV